MSEVRDQLLLGLADDSEDIRLRKEKILCTSVVL